MDSSNFDYFALENFFISPFKTWSFGPVANPAKRGLEKLGYADVGS
jgi:hypothetical protein